MRYRAFGLSIESELSLTDWAPDPTIARAPDVTIRIASFAFEPHGVTPAGTAYASDGSELKLAFPGVGLLSARSGNEVLVSPAADPMNVEPYLTGPVMAVLMHQRGRLVLHGSAVQIGSVTAAFLGVSGAGKSTVAVALALRGHRLIADDVVAVETDTMRIEPNATRVRLWSDAVDVLGLPCEALEPVRHGLDKWSVSVGSADHCAPLTALFLLNTAESYALSRLASAPATVALLSHCYTASVFRGSADDRLRLHQCAAVVAACAVYRLDVPRSRNDLADVAAAVESDALV